MQLRYLRAAFRLRVLVIALASLYGSTVLATVVRFETTLGDIDVRLYDSATPLSVANFLNYVTSGRYSGTFVHRVPQSAPGVSANFVVQGGGFLLNNSIFAATGIVTDAPIGNEPGITNIRGSLAFAKNSLGATSQWFFNVGNNSFLDNDDFTVFGRVLGSDMDVVDAINALQTVNASVAQNAPGEDFDEIPVTNFQQVINQNDITSDEAVMVSGVTVVDFAAGDYDFNGVVNHADLAVWQSDYGSTIKAEADGNGDGRVDGRDFLLWQRSYGQTSGMAGSLAVVPEPGSVILASIALVSITLPRVWR